MLKQLLFAASLLSPIYGSDATLALEITGLDLPKAPATPPVDSVHTTTHIKLTGNIHFSISSYTPENKTNVQFSLPIWVEGQQYCLTLTFRPFVQGLDEYNTYINKMTLGINRGRVNFEDNQSDKEIVLSFTRYGEFHCLNPGQPNQSESSIAIRVESEQFTDQTPQMVAVYDIPQYRAQNGNTFLTYSRSGLWANGYRIVLELDTMKGYDGPSLITKIETREALKAGSDQ